MDMHQIKSILRDKLRQFLGMPGRVQPRMRRDSDRYTCTFQSGPIGLPTVAQKEYLWAQSVCFPAQTKIHQESFCPANIKVINDLEESHTGKELVDHLRFGRIQPA